MAKGTDRRSFRIDSELWSAALAEAERRGESLSDAVRSFLRRYVSRGQK